MKHTVFFTLLITALAGNAVAAPPLASEARPPVSTAPARPGSPETFVYEQKPLAGQPVLVAPQQAQSIIDRFKDAYPKLGSPRILIYINRDLVDEKTGVKLTSRSEKTDITRSKSNSDFQADQNARGPAHSNSVTVTAGGNVTVRGADGTFPGKGQFTRQTDHVSNENRYRIQERQESLADKQTVRDVERLFGRPLRVAGVSLVDQRIATQLIGDKPLKTFTVATQAEPARKDREALGKIADVVLEVLISSRNITVGEVSSDKVYSVPDIQATAIRLSDSKIIGQASSTDVIGKDRYAGRIARTFDVREIAEATALALIEDMTTGVK